MEFRKDSAILVVDMQVGFCSDAAIDVVYMPKSRIQNIEEKIIPNIASFLDKGRERGIPVLYLCSNRNVIGRGVEIVKELSPQSGDFIFWRYHPAESPLKEEYGFDSWLLFCGVRCFYIVGIYREHCVARIADELSRSGYDTIIVEECTG